MKRTAKILLWVLVAVAVLLIRTLASAQEESRGNQPSLGQQESAALVTDIGDIIPSAAKLSGRLAVLENNLHDLPDPSVIEGKCGKIEARLDRLAGDVKQQKESKTHEFDMLVTLKNNLENEEELLAETSQPLRKRINRLGTWRKEWQEEKIRWDGLQASVLKEGDFNQLESTLAKAHHTIDRPRVLISPQLEAMLTVQRKVGNIQEKIYVLNAELDGLVSAGKRSALINESPPLLSAGYFSQFGKELWHATTKGTQGIAWPDATFVAPIGLGVFPSRHHFSQRDHCGISKPTGIERFKGLAFPCSKAIFRRVVFWFWHDLIAVPIRGYTRVMDTGKYG